MRIWPFRRRAAFAAGATNVLRPGEFPLNERQIGADMEQWLVQRRAFSQNWRARAGSGGSSASIWVFLLALLIVVALAYFVYLQPNGITLSSLWSQIVAGVEDLFSGLPGLGAGGGNQEIDVVPGVTKHNKDHLPALITSTPQPAPAG